MNVGPCSFHHFNRNHHDCQVWFSKRLQMLPWKRLQGEDVDAAQVIASSIMTFIFLVEIIINNPQLLQWRWPQARRRTGHHASHHQGQNILERAKNAICPTFFSSLFLHLINFINRSLTAVNVTDAALPCQDKVTKPSIMIFVTKVLVIRTMISFYNGSGSSHILVTFLTQWSHQKPYNSLKIVNTLSTMMNIRSSVTRSSNIGDLFSL